MPYTMDCNDMRFAIQAGFTDGQQFEGYLKDSFDMLYAEGVAGAPKMLSIGLHCRLAGRPGRALALKRALEHMAGHDGVWFATREEIADHWARVHPPVHIQRPSRMSRADFVAAYGGIFEHSPGSPRARTGWNWGRPMTMPPGCIMRWRGSSDPPARISAWACCARTRIWRGNWPPRGV